MLSTFLQALLIGYSGAMMPGSLLTYTINKSIKSGAKAGLIIALGHSLLEFFLVILLFLGIGKYLGSNTAQMIIGFAGGMVLLVFGLQMVLDVIRQKINIDFEKESGGKFGGMLLSSAVITVSNPYFFIWWSIVGLGLMTNAYSTFGLVGIVLFYIGHICADITWYVFISAIISRTRQFISMKVYRIIIVILGICLIGFGIRFILSSVQLTMNFLK